MKVILILAYILTISLCACNENKAVKRALELAEENRGELEKVIEHYKNADNKDPLKLKAALYLIGNMPRHHSIDSEVIRAYQAKILGSGFSLRVDTLNSWWETLSVGHRSNIEFDVRTLKADFLIRDIDKAFEVWYASPWKDEVDFHSFCRHILPIVSGTSCWPMHGEIVYTTNTIRILPM